MNCFTTPFGGFSPSFGTTIPTFGTPFGGQNLGGFSPIQNNPGFSNTNPFVNTVPFGANPMNLINNGHVNPFNVTGFNPTPGFNPINWGGFTNPITGVNPVNFTNPATIANPFSTVNPMNWTNPVNNPWFSSPLFTNTINPMSVFNPVNPFAFGGVPFTNVPFTNPTVNGQTPTGQNGQPTGETVNQNAIPFGFQGFFPFATPFSFNGVNPGCNTPFNNAQPQAA